MKGTANIDAWNSLPMAERAAMIKVAVGNGITNLQDIRDRYNEFAWGGPSEAAKKRIERWEGKAMTGAKDPLSGKYAKNSSFEDEARRFYSVLPKNIREQVLSNPELADNLYSYSYNVGAGNFKKRVVPALQRYYAGKGSVEDIQRSMWASGDARLRGLQRRRAEERAGVGRALLGGDMPIPTFYTGTAATGNDGFMPFKPMIPEVFGAEQPIEAPVTIEDIPPTIQKPEEPVYSPEEIERQERAESLANLSRMFSLMNGTSESSGMLGALNLLTRNYAEGGKIHIKPSHRGRFTRLKERTGHSASWFKAHGTPAQKKMATFELNARKWKHGLGGYLYPDGGYMRENGSPVSFDPITGDLIDQTTGQIGTLMLPEIKVTARDPRKPVPTAFDRHEEWLRPMMDFVPGVGDALQAKDAVEDAKNGNYLSAGLNAGMLLLPNAIEKPAKWALRGISKRSGSQLGDAVLRFIGENPSYRTATGTPMSREGLTQAEEDLLNVFESRGIDTSIFTPEDLQEALNLRRMEVRKSLPSNKRYNYIETNNLGYDISDNIGYDTAGNTMILTGPDNRLHIEMVKNLDPSMYHGVSQRGYDAAIRLAQSTGREGLVSGERLLMPEVTTNVYKNYPNKKKIGDYGVWGPEDATAIEGNPVYLLDEPSRIGRVKSDIFDPMIINNRGDMNVLWDKKNLMWGYGGFLKNKKCKQ